MFVCLFLCRLKQTTQPAEGVDYNFLQPLYNTVEELFINGTPVLSQVFIHFNKLNTLSLGWYSLEQIHTILRCACVQSQ